MAQPETVWEGSKEPEHRMGFDKLGPLLQAINDNITRRQEG